MKRADELLQPDNLVAWCIVPFDARQRGPRERIEMLGRLGFRHYAWDWRDVHLATWPEEIALAQAHGIEISAVWIWVDANTDAPGTLSAGNRAVMAALQEAGVATDYWVGFHENYFAGLSHEQRVEKGAAMIEHLCAVAASNGCTVSLYNHGGWFGESENQVAILERVNDPRAGIVYNFHHAHHEVDEWPENLARLRPWLRAVNLNGMIPAGPKIVRLGAGTHEETMLRVLLESDWSGPVGVIGHDDSQDVEQVLQQNLAGLAKLRESLTAN